jgi:hypothetical protein
MLNRVCYCYCTCLNQTNKTRHSLNLIVSTSNEMRKMQPLVAITHSGPLHHLHPALSAPPCSTPCPSLLPAQPPHVLHSTSQLMIGVMNQATTIVCLLFYLLFRDDAYNSTLTEFFNILFFFPLIKSVLFLKFNLMKYYSWLLFQKKITKTTPH